MLSKRTRSGRPYGYANSIVPFAANYLRSAISRRTRRRLNSGRSYTQTSRRRNRGTSGQGVTLQHDARMIYRKKSMPRRRRKAWKRFKNKVNAVAEKDLGSRTVVFNKTVTFSQTTSGYNSVGSLNLYGQRSTIDSIYNDLNNISGLENFAANPTSAAGETIQASTKFLFQSAIMDLTIKNGSGINDGTGYIPDYRGKMEIDVYEMYVKKDATDGINTWGYLEDLLKENFNSTQKIGGAGTALEYNQRGVTPWDCNYSLSRFGIKIVSKKKYFVSNQETITYQVRDPKRRVCMQKDMNTENGFNRPGWTKVIFLIGKLVPGLSLGVGAGQWQESMVVGVTRKYLYKIEGMNEDRMRYLPNT